MATIDNLDISIYNMYAARMRMLEQVDQKMRLSESRGIPPQTQLVNTLPQLTELDILLGVAPEVTPWAYFFPPKRFNYIRRSPFSFFRVAPSLGTLDEHDEFEEQIMATVTNSPEEEKEKQVILNCLNQIGKINNWLGFIIGRVGQFLQG